MSSVALTPSDAKAAAGLQARAALAGIRLDPVESDEGRTVWIVTRWAFTKQCSSLEEARDLLERMGVEV